MIGHLTFISRLYSKFYLMYNLYIIDKQNFDRCQVKLDYEQRQFMPSAYRHLHYQFPLASKRLHIHCL